MLPVLNLTLFVAVVATEYAWTGVRCGTKPMRISHNKEPSQ